MLAAGVLSMVAGFAHAVAQLHVLTVHEKMRVEYLLADGAAPQQHAGTGDPSDLGVLPEIAI